MGVALLLIGSIACGDVLVTTTADENNGSLNPALGAGVSLREAVLHAPDASVIGFAPALDGQTFTLTLGQIPIGKNLSISAASLATGVIVSGNHASRVFSVSSSKTVTLTALDLVNGDVTGDGGAILNAGNLTLDRCELFANEASDGGGAIENSGTLTLTACTLAGNTAEVGGGAIEHASGTLTATNCTFSGNTAEFGGAIDGDGSSTIRLYSCTLSGNHATNDGGGIEESSGTLLLENTIIAGNTAVDQGPDLKASSINTQAGVNLLSSTSGLGGSFGGIVASPNFAALADNGGRTRTMLPLAGSPAINAGGTTALTTDQRGLTRVVGAAVDIGAVEVQAAPIVTTTANAGPGSLRDIVAAAPAGATITFAPALDGQTIALTSPVVVTRVLVIDGSERLNLAISGGDLSGIFTVDSGISVELRGLTLRDGNRTSGGAIHNSGTLALHNCNIRESHSDESGGGIFNAPGAVLEVTDCEIADNHAEAEGGGVFSGGTAIFTRSSLMDNSGGNEDGGSGGGISSSGSLSLFDSVVRSNGAYGSGGGIISRGTLVMARCTVEDNQTFVDGDGGGLLVSGGTITGCTFAGNYCQYSGGGIFHGAGTLVLVNTTLAGNDADYEYGGGLYTRASTVLTSCTISGNNAYEEGGGVYVGTPGHLSLTNSIIAANQTFSSGPDLRGTIETQTGVNLVSSTNGIVGPFTGIVAPPQLGPLSDNGGPTLTMLPQPGSPAIDAAGSTTLTVDQRGLPRIAGPAADIGAVEVQESVVQPLWLDVLAYRNLGQTVITSSPPDIGNPDMVFDGNLGTLYRSADVNPAFIQLAFTSARTIDGFRVSFSSGGPYQWKVEAADTQADMDGKTGSWAELLPWQPATGDDLLHDQDLPAPATARICKLVVQRVNDNYVHINEWGLHGLVTIGAIDVVAASLELPHPNSRAYTCTGWATGGTSYDLTGEVAWSSSNPDAATVAASGMATTVAPGTTEIGAVLGDLGDHGDHGDLTVVPLGPPPGSFAASAFHTTAHLTWSAGPANAASYLIYRRSATGSYPAQPTARIGPRQDHTDHGLTPGETYFWKIAAFDSSGSLLTGSAETSATLLASGSGLRRIAAPKLLIALYHGEMTAEEKNSAVAGMQLALDWFYRNSEQRFFMDVTWMPIEAAVPDKGDGYAAIEADLRSRGVVDGQYDLCFTTGAGIGPCLGGFLVFNGTTRASKGIVCGVPYPAKNPGVNYVLARTFTHEIHHAIDAMVDDAGGDNMLFNHFPWNYPSPLNGQHVDWGLHYDGISKIMRVYDDYAGWNGINHGDYIEVWDTDGDGMADGDSRVAMDEARFGSTVGVADTDADGLGDGREYDRHVYTSLDPQDDDSDGDGRTDGADPQPLYAIPDVIAYTASPPVLNGSVEAKWSKIRNGYFFTSEAEDFGFETYANYDSDYLYLAFRSTRPSMFYRLALDGSGHLGRFESDVRHPDANAGDRATWYADVYAEGNHIEISPFSASASVYDVGVIPGSQVVTGSSGGWYTTEVRIPKVLPHGCGYTYFAPDAPVVEGLQLVPDRVFGINVTMSQSPGWEFAGVWTGLFETHGFVDFALSGSGDLDGDGLDAAAEGTAQTDPLDPDTEGDGMADGWEIANGLSPLVDDALGDADGDGSVNRDEFLCGTDPRNPGSRLRVASITRGAAVTITWTTVHGRTYVVDTSETLDGSWTEVAESQVIELDGTPGTESWADTATSAPRKFYRVRLVTPP